MISQTGSKNGYKRGVSGIFECAFCGTVTTRNYVAQQATSRGLGSLQTAVVAEGDRGRIYLPAEASPLPRDIPHFDSEDLNVDLAPNPRDVWCRNFGLMRPRDLFTPRQLAALATLSDLVRDARQQAELDAADSGLAADGTPFAEGGSGARAYADAITVYLSFAVSRLADYNSSLATWKPSGEQVMQTYKRQALPMTWDFPESNVLGQSAICWHNSIKYTAESLLALSAQDDRLSIPNGISLQEDAARQRSSSMKIVSTDPPYYDNIGYADISDFFYVWLRRSLRDVFPSLFTTLAVPKADELVALSYRHGSKDKAEAFFLSGMTQAMHRIAEQAHPAFPVTIYYAFRQSETESEGGTASTGWETFLDAVVRAGFTISGTWPLRTESIDRIVARETNALASSIVQVCRTRPGSAPISSRREFISALKSELSSALTHLQSSNIAPVDLAQAAIGPGMAVYTRYSQVLDAEGKPLSVRDALALINQTIDEALAQQEGDFDADTRFALAWFEQHGFIEGEFGVAETLSKAKNTSVGGLADTGILESSRGKVRLLKPSELPANWDPMTDRRRNDWEVVHHLIRALESGGEGAAAELVAKLGSTAETARELAYRLYTICERKKRPAEALSYNALVQSWPEISRLAQEGGATRAAQASLFAGA